MKEQPEKRPNIRKLGNDLLGAESVTPAEKALIERAMRHIKQDPFDLGESAEFEVVEEAGRNVDEPVKEIPVTPLETPAAPPIPRRLISEKGSENTGTALTLPPNKAALLRVVRQITVASSASLSESGDELRGLVLSDPDIVRQLTRIAALNPDLFPYDPSLKIDSSLGSIRKNYQRTLEFFNEDQKTEQYLLSVSESVAARVEEDQAVLRNIEGNEQISKIEVLLRILIEDGSLSNITTESYQQIKQSQEVFFQLSDIVHDNRNKYLMDLTTEERESVIAMGQRLNLVRRLIEFNPDDERIKGDKKIEHKDRDTDFSSRMAELRIMGQVIEVLSLQTGPKNRAFITSLVEGYIKARDLILDQYPDKTGTIRAQVGYVVGINRSDRWVEVLNVEALPKSEQISFTNPD